MAKFKHQCQFCESKDVFSYYNGGKESELVCDDCAEEHEYEKPPRITKTMAGEIVEVQNEYE